MARTFAPLGRCIPALLFLLALGCQAQSWPHAPAVSAAPDHGQTPASAELARMTAAADDLLVVDRRLTVADQVLPAGLRLEFRAGGGLEVPAGQRVVLRGRVEAPPVRIFWGQGRVEMPAAVQEAQAAWWGDLAAAVAGLGPAPASLVLGPGAWPVERDLEIGPNLNLRLLPGAVVHVREGRTLTVLGGFDAGPAAAFAGAGQVVLRGAASLCPEWFGAKPEDPGHEDANSEALARCVASAFASGKPVFFRPMRYYFGERTVSYTIPESPRFPTDGITLYSEAAGSAMPRGVQRGCHLLYRGEGVFLHFQGRSDKLRIEHMEFRNLRIYNLHGSKRGTAIKLEFCTDYNLQELNVRNFEKNLHLTNTFVGVLNNCSLVNGGAGLYSDNVLNNLTLLGGNYHQNDANVHIRAGAGINIIGCNLEGNGIGVLADDVDSLNIIGCYFESLANAAPMVIGSQGLVKGLTVTGSVFKGNAAIVLDQVEGARIVGNVSNNEPLIAPSPRTSNIVYQSSSSRYNPKGAPPFFSSSTTPVYNLHARAAFDVNAIRYNLFPDGEMQCLRAGALPAGMEAGNAEIGIERDDVRAAGKPVLRGRAGPKPARLQFHAHLPAEAAGQVLEVGAWAKGEAREWAIHVLRQGQSDWDKIKGESWIERNGFGSRALSFKVPEGARQLRVDFNLPAGKSVLVDSLFAGMPGTGTPNPLAPLVALSGKARPKAGEPATIRHNLGAPLGGNLIVTLGVMGPGRAWIGAKADDWFSIQTDSEKPLEVDYMALSRGVGVY